MKYQVIKKWPGCYNACENCRVGGDGDGCVLGEFSTEKEAMHFLHEYGARYGWDYNYDYFIQKKR